jgi:hypothetical protein
MGKYLKNVTAIALAIATMITNHKTLQFTILCQYKHHTKSFETKKESRAKKSKEKGKKKERKKEIDQGDLTKYDFNAFNISKHDGFFHMSFTIPLYVFACPF